MGLCLSLLFSWRWWNRRNFSLDRGGDGGCQKRYCFNELLSFLYVFVLPVITVRLRRLCFLRLCFSLHLPPFSIRFDYLILRCPARFLHANGNDCAHAFTQIKTIPGALLETVGEPVVRPPPALLAALLTSQKWSIKAIQEAADRDGFFQRSLSIIQVQTLFRFSKKQKGKKSESYFNKSSKYSLHASLGLRLDTTCL